MSRIEDGRQHVEHAVGDHEKLSAGHQYPLDAAYCRATVERESVLSVQNARTSSEIRDAAYEAFGVDTYIGSTVLVDGKAYGTVCFAGRDPRENGFSETDELFVELVARLVGFGLEREVERRRREAQTARLATENRRFERIAETSFDIVFRLDDAGRFTYVSAAAEQTLGYDPSDLVGQDFLTLIGPDSFEAAADGFQQALDGTPVRGVELTLRDAGGNPVHMEVNATPVSDEVASVQGVGRDVTARRRRERELRIKTRAMDEAAIPIAISDATRPDNPVVYTNEAFEATTGYALADIEGRNCRILQGSGTDPERVAILREGIEQATTVSTELLNYRRDGVPFWNHVMVTPVRDQGGQVTHFLGFQQDVTERKRTERLVELLNRVLRHNLANELTVIEGQASLLETDSPEHDVASNIRRPVRRLLSLSERARELETYAKRARQPVRLDVGSVVQTVATAHRAQFPTATITVTDECERAACTGQELRRALEELVTNAIVHSPDADVTVEIAARDDGDDVEVTVTDDGPGIPSSEAAVVRNGRETPLEHGRGLGLWLVNWIVTRYGGSFQISRDDGTRATLRLPAVEGDQPVADATRRPTTLFR